MLWGFLFEINEALWCCNKVTSLSWGWFVVSGDNTRGIYPHMFVVLSEEYFSRYYPTHLFSDIMILRGFCPCLWLEADYCGWVIIFIIGPGPGLGLAGNGLSWDKKTRKQMPHPGLAPRSWVNHWTLHLLKLFYKQNSDRAERRRGHQITFPAAEANIAKLIWVERGQNSNFPHKRLWVAN